MAIVSTHPKMLHEVFNVINDHDDVLSAMKSCLHLSFVRQYLEMAVSEEWTTLDVKSTQTKDYNYHISMAGAFMLNRHTFRIVSEVIMNEKVINSAKVTQYKALMEMLYADEAMILRAILMKNLTDLYPRITFDVINEALYFNKVVV